MDKQEYNFFTLFVFYGMAIGGGAALIYGLFFKIDVSNLEVMKCCYKNGDYIYGSKRNRSVEEIVSFNNLDFNERTQSKRKSKFDYIENCDFVYLVEIDSVSSLAEIIYVQKTGHSGFETKLYVPIEWLKIVEDD